MNKKYITPALCRVPMNLDRIVCASNTITLKEVTGEAGDEASSRDFSAKSLWDNND